MTARAARRTAPAVLLVSAAALGYEVLLARLFAIAHWHHLAFFVISLALLGYGASGSAISLAQGRWLRHAGRVAARAALALGAAMPLAWLLAQWVPFNALELVWRARQWVYLAAIYLLLALPFFCAATCVGVALARWRRAIHRLYFADLLGAGLGAAAAVALTFVLPPQDALKVLAFAAVVAAFWLYRTRAGRTLCVAAGVLLWLLPGHWLAPRPSPYKGLSQALEVAGAEVIAHTFGPLGLISVVDSREVPLRHAPGLSLLARDLPPRQLGVYLDGDGPQAVTRYDGDPGPLAFLDALPLAAPYHMGRRDRVLVLGAGTGLDILLARWFDARRVDAVELNARLVRLLRGPLRDFAGPLYDPPRVNLYIAEARHFAASRRATYDLVQLSLVDAFAAASSGNYALAENYLYTAEAFGDYLDRLAPGGLLAVTRWLKLPQRDALKLFATAAEALSARGGDPARQLALLRSWNTSTLLVRQGPFTAAEIAALRRFARERAFDLDWYPGMATAEANRFHRLPRPWLHRGARALLGPGREDFIARYPYDIRPATDDRPYFNRFLRWDALGRLAARQRRAGLAPDEWGELLLVAALIQALLAGALLILLPLAARRPPRHGPRLRAGAYFGLLGLGFLFIEIALIQKFILLLGHPLYAIAVVLAGMLVFAGLGSLASAGFARACRTRDLPVVPLALVALVLAAGLVVLALPGVGRLVLAWPDAGRIAAALALLAPLGFLLGMPFPLGLARLRAEAPELIPWAWGINGCSSVVAAMAAMLLAMQFGFTALVVLALGLYALGAALWPGWRGG